MLKIDKKFKDIFLRNNIIKHEIISPLKTYRLYMFDNNKAMFIETKFGEGCFNDFLKMDKDGFSYEKHEIDKYNIYIMTYK